MVHYGGGGRGGNRGLGCGGQQALGTHGILNTYLTNHTSLTILVISDYLTIFFISDGLCFSEIINFKQYFHFYYSNMETSFNMFPIVMKCYTL